MGSLRLFWLVLRSWGSRKLRVALTVLGITLGVAVIFATSINNQSTDQVFQKMMAQVAGNADLWVQTTNADGLEEKVVDRIARLPEVAHASPILSRGATIRVEGESEDSPITLMGVLPEAYRQIQEPVLARGSFFEGGPARSIVLVENFAREHGATIGRTVYVGSAGGRVAFTVVGILSLEGVARYQGGAVAMTELSTMQRLLGLRGRVKQIEVVKAPGVPLSAVRAAIEEELPDGAYTELPSERAKEISSILTGLKFGLSFFSAIALFIGMFLIYNTFAMTVAERVREYGILRSLGATRLQVLVLVLAESLGLGVLSTGLGLAVGLVLARGLIFLMGRMLNTDVTSYDIPVSGVVVSAAVGLGATLLAAGIPAWRAGRVSPLDCIRAERGSDETLMSRYGGVAGVLVFLVGLAMAEFPVGPTLSARQNFSAAGDFVLLLGAALAVPTFVGPLAASIGRVSERVAPVAGRLARGNLVRGRMRSAITMATVMISLAMMVSVSAMSYSVMKSVERWRDKVLGSDMFVGQQTVGTGAGSLDAAFEARLRRVPGIDRMTPLYITNVKHKDSMLFTVGLDTETYLEVESLDLAKGNVTDAIRALEEGDKVLISTALADDEELDIGDTLELETRQGLKKLQVAAIINDYSGESHKSAYMSSEQIKDYFGVDRPENFHVRLKPGASVAEVERRIEASLGRRYSLDILTTAELRKMIDENVNNSFAAFQVIIWIAMVVAVVGITNTLAMGVLERVREIGLLRAVGAPRSLVGRMIVLEAVLMGLGGFVLSVPLGIFMSARIVRAMITVAKMNVAYEFPVASLYQAAGIALVASVAAALYPARKAAGLDIVKALEYE